MLSKTIAFSVLALLAVACASTTAPTPTKDKEQTAGAGAKKPTGGDTKDPPPAATSPTGGDPNQEADPTTPEEAKADEEAEKCFVACIQTKGPKAKAFGTCATSCKDDEACWDGCWTSSGCEAAETECETDIQACEKQCGIVEEEGE
jgi:hypothetical protein